MRFTFLTLCFSLVLLACVTTLQAQHVFAGQIRWQDNDDTGIGITVYVKGTNNGTVSDFDGNFRLELDTLPATVLLNYVGMIDQEIELTESYLESFAKDPVIYVEEYEAELTLCYFYLPRYTRLSASSGLRNTPYGAELQFYRLFTSIPSQDIRLRYELGRQGQHLLEGAFQINTGLQVSNRTVHLWYQFRDIALSDAGWQRHLLGTFYQFPTMGRISLATELAAGQGKRRREQALERLFAWHAGLHIGFRRWSVAYKYTDWSGLAEHAADLGYRRSSWSFGLGYHKLEQYEELNAKIGYTWNY